MADIRIEIAAETRDAVKSLNTLTKTTNKVATESAKNLGRIEKATSTLSGVFNVFAGNVLAGAVTKGFQTAGRAATAFFDTFVTQGIEAANRQEDAINGLNSALALSGKFSEEASQGLQDYASSLQQITRFGDEAILETQALLQSLGQLDQEGLERATKATLDLATALKIDLKSAATLVGKAAAGEVSSFSRFGLIIEKGKTQAETFANALKGIEAQFGGAAEAAVKTFSGSVEQLGNTFGDLQEETGFLITQNPIVVSGINALNDAFKQAIKFVQENKEELTTFVADAVIFAVDSLLVLAATLDAVAKGFNIFSAFIVSGVDRAISAVEALRFAISGDFDLAFQTLQQSAKKSFEEIRKAATDDTVFIKFGNALADIRGKLEQAKKPTDELTDSFNKQNEAALANAEAQKNAFNITAELNQIKLDQDREDQETKLVDQEIFQEQEILLLEQGLSRQAAARVVAQARILASEKKFQEARAKLAAAATKAQQQSLSSLFDFEKNTNAGRAENFKSTLSTISSLQSQNNKTLFFIGKAAALSLATIDGIAAVQKALASAPPPFNFALAALVGVATAANVAKIASTPPPGAQNGLTEVPPGFPNDSFPIRVESGERIISGEQNQDLKEFLAGSSGQSAILASINDKLGNLQPNVRVSIDDEDVFASVNRSLEAGLRFSTT